MVKVKEKKPVAVEASSAPIEIGDRLREIRRDRGLTLMEVAEKTGISSSALSKIENNKMSPTFANLIKIAEGLQISLTELVATNYEKQMNSARLAVTRADEVEYRETPSYDMGPLCADLTQKSMTPLIERVKARYPVSDESKVSHGGEEFVYVLKGEVDVLTDCYAPVRLKAGDSTYLDSRMHHTYVSVSRRDAEILMIWLNPQEQSGSKNLELAEALLNEKP
ncbi:MAG: helix-turn-helix domain-containing protein [Methyloligellaceae bacterium]